MSGVRTIDAVLTSGSVDPLRSESSKIFLLVAVFADPRGAPQGEVVLGQLWAAGDLDVLDGVLVHRGGAADTTVRPLHSLPRRAALPPDAWTDDLVTSAFRSRSATGDTPTEGPSPAVGVAAVLVFTTTTRLDHIVTTFRTMDAAVSVSTVTAASYACLRHPHRAPIGPGSGRTETSERSE